MKGLIGLLALAIFGTASFAFADGYVAVSYNSVTGYAADGVTYIQGGTYGSSSGTDPSTGLGYSTGITGDAPTAQRIAIANCQAVSPVGNDCAAHVSASTGFITLWVGYDASGNPHYQMKYVGSDVSGTPSSTETTAQGQCDTNAGQTGACTERVFISVASVYQQ